MITGDQLDELRPALADMAPLLRRALSLDPDALARVRAADARIAVLVRLPFGVVVSRTLSADLPAELSYDRTYAAAEALAWVGGDQSEPPQPRDGDWRGSAPPTHGWQRVDTVPEDVIRGLVRSGALALRDAAASEGVAGAHARAEVADALLDSVVLTVAGAGRRAQVTLRSVSALVRMGFLARGSAAAIDVAGRWVRVAARYGSVYAETSGGGLGALRPT